MCLVGFFLFYPFTSIILVTYGFTYLQYICIVLGPMQVGVIPLGFVKCHSDSHLVNCLFGLTVEFLALYTSWFHVRA